MSSASADGIIVRAPSRAHITLIDMNGALGRVDGSIGFALQEPALEVRFRRSHGLACPTVLRAEVLQAAARLGVPADVEVEIQSKPPAHRGFGSGTQRRLAITAALAAITGQPVDPPALTRIAAISGRGGTSGIGIHAFIRGGVIVDAGHCMVDKPCFLPSRHASGVQPPRLLFAAEPPPEWGVLLALPAGLCGLDGTAEREFMAANTPLPLAEVQAVSHRVLMGLIPAVLDADVSAFGQHLTALQDVGWKLRHWRRPEVARWRPLLDVLLSVGATGAGLSSTGSLVFATYDRKQHDGEELTRRVIAKAANRGLPLEWARSTTIGGAATVTPVGNTMRTRTELTA